MTHPKRVIVAMSGGVDSSVTAALLIEQGYEVIGVTMQIWDPDVTEVDGDHVGCCSLSAVDDARRVAEKLGIPHYVMNFRSIFNEKVVDYFVSEYIRGRTPNPCIACNRHVKFDALLKKALALEAHYVATGHYARLAYDRERNRYTIRRARDRRKDQTYVLYNLTQEQIRHTLMPLGDYHKDEVRAMAARRGLSVAEKPESQEICFIPDNNYGNFIMQKMGSEIKPGSFLDPSGKKIGQHRGIPFYTIGQRRGLGIAAGEKIYVVDIDPQNNTVMVGPEEHIQAHELLAADNNFILMDRPDKPTQAEAQIRYNAQPSPALLTPRPDGRMHVAFERPQRAITPGQSVVYYQGEYLLGGGTIIKDRP